MAKKEKNQENQSILTMDVGDLFKKKPNAPVKRGKRGAIKATKRTMNFVHHESDFNLMKVLPVVLVVILALVVFAKVGFMDPLAEKTRAYSQLATKQEQLAAVNARLVGYDELANLYGRYSYGLMNESEINLVSRMDVLALVEKEIASKATIENFAVNNNVLTMNIYGITLQQASDMVNRLESNALVTHASVNSAAADDGVEARIFISITLTKNVEEAA